MLYTTILHMAAFSFLSTLLFLCLICSSHEAESYKEIMKNTIGGISIELIHRDSPSSPFYDPSKTRFERQTNSFHRSIARSLDLMISSKQQQQQVSSPVNPYSGEYLAKIGIGTPPVEVLAIVDTHSDLTWTQCAPCDKGGGCYTQKTPLFDPRKSTTYANLTCGSDQCALIDSEPLRACDNDDDPCTYYTFYRGDANTRSGGDIALETFTFSNNSGLSDVLFGCGHDNRGALVEKGSGVIGLGRGQPSVVNQLAKRIGGAKFSYCLTSNNNVSSKISFGGNAAVVKGPNVVSTPMKQGQLGILYYVSLEGISVGNHKLELLSSDSTTSKISGAGNMIIDSSTAMTVISNSMLYNELEKAFVNSIKGGYKRVPDPTKGNGLCYDNGGGELLTSAPQVTLHFAGGADLVLSQETSFVEVQKGVFCLTFVRGGVFFPADSMLGNIHQTNFLIGFDLDNNKVDFMPTDCTKPQ